MRAYFLENPEELIDQEKLYREGMFYLQLSTVEREYAEPLQRLCEARGYVAQDIVYLGASTPNLDALLEKFFHEHLHTDEEIRFVVDGEGIFDLRDVDDRWMRVHVVPGDLLIVPAHKYHRFSLTETRSITCKRLFQSQDGWAAVFR